MKACPVYGGTVKSYNFDAIRQLMAPPMPGQREMGYHTLIDRKKQS